MSLLQNLEDRRKHEITEEDYDYFLEVLPPTLLHFGWGDERWDFGFAEGYDYLYAFKNQHRTFFAPKTDILNPNEESDPTNKTAPGLIVDWMPIGKNRWIGQASDPPFSIQSFQRWHTDDEPLDSLTRANWYLGQAFYLGNICVIQQVAGGDEWTAIKDGCAIECISFATNIARDGRQAAQAIINRIRATSTGQCRSLNY